jgi:hypothetical protein
MREYSNDQIDQFMEDLELQVIQSRLETMKCLICSEDTLERVVGFGPGKPARPIIFAVCECCKVEPWWEREVNKIFEKITLEEI